MPILRRSLLAAGAIAPVTAPALGQTWQAFPERGRRRWARELPIIRLGLPSLDADGAALSRLDAYARLLENTFGVPVTSFQPGTEEGMAQAFAGMQVDLAFVSPMGYAAAWLESSGNVEPFLVTLGPDGGMGTIALAIVRSDYWILDFEMLRRRSFAWIAPDSLDGYLLPRMEMRSQGVDADSYFSRTIFAGGHEQAILAVLTRQVDGGITWASGLGEDREGFTRSTMRDMAAANLINLRDLRIVWRSSPIPNPPIVMRRNVPPGFREDMLAFHLALPNSRPDLFRPMARGSIGWAPITAAPYERFIQLRVDQVEQQRAAAEQRRREEAARLAAEEKKQREEAAQRRRQLAEERRRRFEAQFR